jgi:hypothetical protein
LLAKDDNAVVKLTGETLQTVEGSITVGNLLKTMNGAGAIVGSNINVISSVELVSADGWRIRQGSDNAILENLRDLGNLYLRAFVSGNTAGDLYLNDIGGNTIVPILKALATTGLVVQNSAGTEKLKVGASTGADVQVTGTLSTTDTLTAETAIGKAVSVNAQTGTSYTLVLGDAGKIVTMTNASANTLTIPTNASVAYATGTVINVIMGGAGTTSITGDTGVTVNGISAGSGDISAQYQGVALIKTATDTWIASGAIGTVA